MVVAIIMSVHTRVHLEMTLLINRSIALKRKKAHRRAKRRADRKRRKALAAAGLTEEGVNESRNEAVMQEQLDDLQRQHRSKRKSETGVVSSPSARSKVRSWRAGLLRRRKGRNGESEPDAMGTVQEKPEEQPPVEGADGLRGSQDTDRSTPTVPSVENGDGSGSDGLDSRMDTISSEATTASAPEPNAAAEPTGPAPPSGTTSTTYFPPAYRPASVRSMQGASSSTIPAVPSSSSNRPNLSDEPAHSAVEKTHAPGYYPAPATAEGEVALAVASRSEGKGRMPIPSESEPDESRNSGEHTGHVATDDKRVLERMRMAASAPPGQSGEEDGPSAPHVEVDESGFERMPTVLETPTLTPPLILGRELSSSATNIIQHPELPAPPQPTRQAFHRSYSVENELHEQLDELNLLPSAPPRPPIPTRSSAPDIPISDAPPVIEQEANIVPSAPPLLEHGDDEETESHRDSPPTPIISSAPPLPAEDEDEVEEIESRQADEGGNEGVSEVEDNSEPTGSRTRAEMDDSTRRPSEAPSEPRLFLPKYEP